MSRGSPGASHIVPLAAGIALTAMLRPLAPRLGIRWLPWGLGAYWSGVGGSALHAMGAAAPGQQLERDRDAQGSSRAHPLSSLWLLRHPIYTGLLAALFGMAISSSALQALLAFTVCIAALGRTHKIEDAGCALFGADYDRCPAAAGNKMAPAGGRRRQEQRVRREGVRN